MSITSRAHRVVEVTGGMYDCLAAAWSLRSALRAHTAALESPSVEGREAEDLAAARARVEKAWAQMTDILSRGTVSVPITPTFGEDPAEHSSAADFIALALLRIRQEAARRPLQLSYVTRELEDLERLLRRSARADAAASRDVVH